jgi:serine/threonine protein phosphatase PrpC
LLEDTLVEEDIHPQYASVGLTDAGRLRTSNQDAFVLRDEVGIWAVADGMGGYRDGDVASRMISDALLLATLGESLDSTLANASRQLDTVNAHLYAAATRPRNPVLSGSTVAMMVVHRTSCAMAWAGDSRVYRLRHARFEQLTVDHSWTAQFNLPSEENDHAITRAVGGDRTLQLDVRRDRVLLGDRYLLCSDGLTRELNDAQIALLLAEPDASKSAHALIDATLQAGARDNVTVVIVDAA